LLGKDVLLIEYGVAEICRYQEEAAGEAIIFALRRMQAEIDELADLVLPPMPPEEEKRINDLLAKRGRS
jgi:hypothetical protein